MFRPLVDLIFPQTCNSCDKLLLAEEEIICTTCRHSLPICNWPNPSENPIVEKLKGRLHISYADALLYFEKKSVTQGLIHNLKYKQQRYISKYLGQWHAEKLSHQKWAKTIDVVIPVPLHRRRKLTRGYNQVEDYAKEICNSLNCLYDDKLLIKLRNSKTQVFKNKFLRTQVLDNNFSITDTEKYRGKHIALVDDLITTGATAEACCIQLNKIKDLEISILVMAVA